jgi:hypothetical protein
MGTFYREESNGIESLAFTFDNVLEEAFDDPAIVTRRPVQNTVKVSDHRQEESLQLTVTGLVTETPWESFLSGFGAQGFTLNESTGLVVGEFGNPAILGNDLGPLDENYGQRSQEAVKFWRGAKADLLSYFSNRLGFIDNLMVENIRYSVTKAHHLVFEIDCVQVEFSESQTVELPPLAVRTAVPSVCPKVDVGSRATDEVVAPADARDISALQAGKELLTGRKGVDATRALDEKIREFLPL